MLRTELVETLELLKPALSSDNTIPVLQCFAFLKGKVVASRETLTIEAPCNAAKDIFAVNGSMLLGLLNASQAENVVFELQENTVQVTLGKTVSKFPFFEEKDLIIPAIKKDEWPITLEADEDFMTGLSTCETTMARTATMLALNGICLDSRGKAPMLYSCDGDALTRYELGTKPNGKDNYLLPCDFCDAVLRMAAALESTPTIKISDAWAQAEFDSGHKLYARMLETPEPFDYEKQIERAGKGGYKTLPIPDGFNEALARARVFADPESKPTEVAISNGKLRLYTPTLMGDVDDLLPLPQHSAIKVRISASLMQKAVEYCDHIVIRDHCSILTKEDKKGVKILQITSHMS